MYYVDFVRKEQAVTTNLPKKTKQKFQFDHF